MKAKKRYLQVEVRYGQNAPPFRRVYCRFDYVVGGHTFEFALTEAWDCDPFKYHVTHVISGKKLGPGLILDKPRNNEATALACIQYIKAQTARLPGLESTLIERLLKAEAEEVLVPETPPEGICL